MTDLPKPVHLYVKTHSHTGLKYFGRTVDDPQTYRGSGAYWTRHLDTYGSDVSTHVLGTYTDEASLTAAAQQYSAAHGVSTSTEYANLLGEDGGASGEGWAPGADHSARIAALDAAVRASVRRKVITAGASYVPAGDRRFG